MSKIELLVISVSAITVIVGVLLAIKTLIDTRKKYYNEFIESRKRKIK